MKSELHRPRRKEDQSRLRLRGTLRDSEVSLPLPLGLHRLGSDAANDLVLEHEGVSRCHSILFVQTDRVEVIDEGSTNGTFVDGRRVTRATGSEGSVLGFGPVELVLEALDPEDAEMALELTPVPTDGRASPVTLQTTAIAAAPTDDPELRWMDLVRRFYERLRAAEEGDVGKALALLTSELEVSGAVLFELDTGGQPEILAACGRWEPGLFDEVERTWRQKRAEPRAESAGEFFVTTPEVTCFVAGGSPARAPGLAVAGPFAGRRGSRALLKALLTFWQGSQPPPVDAPKVRPAARELDFPPGYVEGNSAAMTRLYGQMRHLTHGDLPVLITGETGVGKELMAQILHRSSPRCQKPLVAINCAAIPSELLEAELFGIGERVATGVAGRTGKFQQAEGGTLFLDEIAEMPAELQAKLLRALQERQVQPVGGRVADVDVRVVAATNADIYDLLEQGRFRRDLFFRLAGDVLEVPALRERRDDIALLVGRFLRRTSRQLGKPIRGVTLGAMRALVEYDWPGNVRELEHQVRRLCHLCPANGAIDSTLIASGMGRRGDAARGTVPAVDQEESSSAAPADPDRPLRDWDELNIPAFEREAIREALRRQGHNQVRTAKLLGISRYRLRRKMELFGLDGSEK